MAGRGKPRFRLSPENVARIEELAVAFGGRDAVVARALAWFDAEVQVVRLRELARDLVAAASELRAAAGELGGLREAVSDLKAAVGRLEALAARFGDAPPRAAASRPAPDEAELKDYYLRVLEEFDGARLKGSLLDGGGS